MGELAEMFDVKTSLIRHWESQFSILKPKRNKKGNRLFSPQDVENLKVIYHLVKERGMTLEGAKKAMKRRAAGGPDDEMKREAELMTRLRHIRALLVEVREDLKSGGEGIVADEEFAAEPVADSVAEPVAESVAASAADTFAEPAADLSAESAAGSASAAAPVADTSVEPAADTPAEPAADTPAESVSTPVAGVLADSSAEPVAESAVEPRRKPVVRIESEETSAGESADAAEEVPAGKLPRTPRRPRRKSDDDDKELFAFYEQSLF